jgi:hypothetical protein
VKMPLSGPWLQACWLPLVLNGTAAQSASLDTKLAPRTTFLNDRPTTRGPATLLIIFVLLYLAFQRIDEAALIIGTLPFARGRRVKAQPRDRALIIASEQNSRPRLASLRQRPGLPISAEANTSPDSPLAGRSRVGISGYPLGSIGKVKEVVICAAKNKNL